MPIDDLLTTRKVAQRLGVTVRQVHGLVERGELAPVTRLDPPTGPLFFSPEDVAAIEAKRAEVAS